MNLKRPLEFYDSNGYHVIKEADGDISARKYVECNCGSKSHLMCIEICGYQWGPIGEKKGYSWDVTLSSSAGRDPFLNSFWQRLKLCFRYLFKNSAYGPYYNCTSVSEVKDLIKDLECAKTLMTEHEAELNAPDPQSGEN